MIMSHFQCSNQASNALLKQMRHQFHNFLCVAHSTSGFNLFDFHKNDCFTICYDFDSPNGYFVWTGISFKSYNQGI